MQLTDLLEKVLVGEGVAVTLERTPLGLLVRYSKAGVASARCFKAAPEQVVDALEAALKESRDSVEKELARLATSRKKLAKAEDAKAEKQTKVAAWLRQPHGLGG